MMRPYPQLHGAAALYLVKVPYFGGMCLSSLALPKHWETSASMQSVPRGFCSAVFAFNGLLPSWVSFKLSFPTPSHEHVDSALSRALAPNEGFSQGSGLTLMGLHRAPVIRPDHEMPDKEMADLKA
jgi:hypothetical protein